MSNCTHCNAEFSPPSTRLPLFGLENLCTICYVAELNKEPRWPEFKKCNICFSNFIATDEQSQVCSTCSAWVDANLIEKWEEEDEIVKAALYAGGSWKEEDYKSVESKPELSLFPPEAILQSTKAFDDGAKKHGGSYNWRGKKDIKVMTYLSKVLRHTLAYSNGQDCAEDSGVSHLAHAMADLAIMLDAMASGDLVDNRPKRTL